MNHLKSISSLLISNVSYSPKIQVFLLLAQAFLCWDYTCFKGGQLTLTQVLLPLLFEKKYREFGRH